VVVDLRARGSAARVRRRERRAGAAAAARGGAGRRPDPGAPRPDLAAPAPCGVRRWRQRPTVAGDGGAVGSAGGSQLCGSPAWCAGG
jgi:hypothetical protein